MKIWKELGIALFRFREYPAFLKNRKRRVFGFGVLLATIHFLITIMIPLIQFQVKTGGIGQIMRDYIPDFELCDGVLWVEEPVALDYEGQLVLIDTTQDFSVYSESEMRTYLMEYYQALLMDSEKVIFKNEGQIQELYFEDVGMDLNREQAADYLAHFSLIFGIVILLLIYIWQILSLFFSALIITIFGMIIVSCTKAKLTFGETYLLVIYSRALPLLMKAVLSFLPFRIPFFSLMLFGISLGILYMACVAVKAWRRKDEGPMEFYTMDAGEYLAVDKTEHDMWDNSNQ